MNLAKAKIEYSNIDCQNPAFSKIIIGRVTLKLN